MRKTIFQQALCLTLLMTMTISAFYQSTAQAWPHVIYSTASLLFFIGFANPPKLHNLTRLFVAVVALFSYTLLTSIFPIKSLIPVLSIASNSLIFATIYSNLKQVDYLENNINKPFDISSPPIPSSRLNIVDMAIIVLVIGTTTHSIILIYQYIEFPARVNGLLRDYSQASLVILLTFGLAYSRIRDNKFSTPLCFILFLGFFATFSRTANFLLLVFLLALAVMEYGKPSFRRFLELLITIVFAAALVYAFPVMVFLEVVDRGELVNHLTTLNSRTTYWFAAWQAILERPLSGYGINTFEFTGIKTLRPQRIVTYVHNDYLQILHDLGVIWFSAMLLAIGFLIRRFAPTRKLWNPMSILKGINRNSTDSVVCWLLVLILAAYMSINFMISSSIFQLIIALIIIVLLHDYKNQSPK